MPKYCRLSIAATTKINNHDFQMQCLEIKHLIFCVPWDNQAVYKGKYRLHISCDLYLYEFCLPGIRQLRRAMDAIQKRVSMIFYRATLRIRDTSHGPVSVYLSVWPSQVGVLLMGLLQLRYEHDSSTIRLRFDYDSATTRYEMRTIRVRYNTLRGVMCFRAIMNMSILSRCCRML